MLQGVPFLVAADIGFGSYALMLFCAAVGTTQISPSRLIRLGLMHRSRGNNCDKGYRNAGRFPWRLPRLPFFLCQFRVFLPLRWSLRFVQPMIAQLEPALIMLLFF